jgi:hypothetical protein
VASLKVVGREAPLARKETSVRLAAAALEMATRGATHEGIRDAVVSLRGAAELCRGAHLCYYPDVWADEVPTRGNPARDMQSRENLARGNAARGTEPRSPISGRGVRSC